jgi:hypothetical protein
MKVMYVGLIFSVPKVIYDFTSLGWAGLTWGSAAEHIVAPKSKAQEDRLLLYFSINIFSVALKHRSG